MNSKKPDSYDYIDYARKLTDEERKWLMKFDTEFHNGYFKPGTKHLHSDDQKKECYSRNNAKNRDLFRRGYSVQFSSDETQDTWFELNSPQDNFF